MAHVAFLVLMFFVPVIQCLRHPLAYPRLRNLYMRHQYRSYYQEEAKKAFALKHLNPGTYLD